MSGTAKGMGGSEPPPEAGTRASAGTADPAGTSEGIESILAALARQFTEVRTEIARLCEVQFDRARLSALRSAWRVGFVALATLVVLALVLAAAWRLMAGLAGGLTVALGGRVWAGDLTAALGVLAAVGGGAVIARAIDRRTRLRRLERKYAKHYPARGERPEAR